MFLETFNQNAEHHAREVAVAVFLDPLWWSVETRRAEKVAVPVFSDSL